MSNLQRDDPNDGSTKLDVEGSNQASDCFAFDFS